MSLFPFCANRDHLNIFLQGIKQIMVVFFLLNYLLQVAPPVHLGNSCEGRLELWNVGSNLCLWKSFLPLSWSRSAPRSHGDVPWKKDPTSHYSEIQFSPFCWTQMVSLFLFKRERHICSIGRLRFILGEHVFCNVRTRIFFQPW